MPFNTLLLTCLKHGTSFHESGCGVRLQKQSRETVLFFVVDDQANPNSTLRDDLEMEEESICDLIVFYAQEDKKVLCLVEAKKGVDLTKAQRQVTNTYRCLRQFLRQSLRDPCRSHFQCIDWRAYIYLHGGAPNDKKELEAAKRALKQIFESEDKFLIRSNPDLGPFLRSS